MAKKSSQMWVWGLVVIVVAALFLAPAAIKSVSDAWSDFWTSFWLPFNDGGDGGDNATQSGNLNLGITVHFTDGTSKTYQATPLNIIPLSLQIEDKEISSVDIQVKVALSYTGSLTAWVIDGEVDLGWFLMGGSRTQISLKTISATGSAWVSGTEKEIWKGTYTASELEATLPEETEFKAVNFWWNVAITLKATISGTESSQSASGLINTLAYHQRDAITGVSVTVTSTSFP